MKNKLLIGLVAVVILSITAITSCQKDDELVPAKEQDSEISKYEKMGNGCILPTEEEYKKFPAEKEPLCKRQKAVAASRYLNTPPVRNQGNEGSCVAWATGYCARSIMYQYKTGGTFRDNVNVFSPEYVYNQIKVSNCASGSYINRGLNLLYNKGVCTWSWWPYESGDCYTQPWASTDQRAYQYRIKGWQTITRTVDNIKAWIAAGYPVVVGGALTNEYYNHVSGYTITSYTNPRGGHAYVVVGYDDYYRAFKIQNSWGTGWGNNGFGWISYDIALYYFTNAYVMTSDL